MATSRPGVFPCPPSAALARRRGRLAWRPPSRRGCIPFRRGALFPGSQPGSPIHHLNLFYVSPSSVVATRRSPINLTRRPSSPSARPRADPTGPHPGGTRSGSTPRSIGCPPSRGRPRRLPRGVAASGWSTPFTTPSGCPTPGATALRPSSDAQAQGVGRDLSRWGWAGGAETPRPGARCAGLEDEAAGRDRAFCVA